VTARDNANVGLATLWHGLTGLSDTYTCYSSALATWAAFGSTAWPVTLNAGLRLGLVEAEELLFGFSHFEPGLGQALGLGRRSSDVPEEAAAAIRAESARSGRVIVAGDGFNLPWHVAYGRRHVPHWFVLAPTDEGVTVVDPFTCRNDLGWQEAALRPLTKGDELVALAAAIPPDDPVHSLREAFAFGTDDRPLPPTLFRWLEQAAAPAGAEVDGYVGPEAVRRLALHFRDNAAMPGAYRQADDLWSIARHRAYLSRRASEVADTNEDEALRSWSDEHAAPLAARWGHVAPLLMQATLALEAGRTPTASLPEALTELADREERAAAAFPVDTATDRASPAGV
jgi:hypothetical protein